MINPKIHMIDFHQGGTPTLNIISVSLLSAAWICKIFFIEIGLIGDMYDLLFKTLSLISVVMVLVINYPKFKERVIKIKYKWNQKRRK